MAECWSFCHRIISSEETVQDNRGSFNTANLFRLTDEVESVCVSGDLRIVQRLAAVPEGGIQSFVGKPTKARTDGAEVRI
jgi:hypothetical protein